MRLGIQAKRFMAFAVTIVFALGLALPVYAYASELEQKETTNSESLEDQGAPAKSEADDATNTVSVLEQTEDNLAPNDSVKDDSAKTEEAPVAAAHDVDVDKDDPLATAAEADAREGAAPAVEGEAAAAAPAVSASAHVQNVGWQAASTAPDGTVTLGTTGRSLRLEAARIQVAGGSVSYKCHVQNVGWESAWASDGAEAGSTGRSWRLEAIRIRLSDELVAAGWSVQYRAHAQDIGWLGWAADGAEAGTTGLSKRLEAVEVRVVRAGTPLPEGGKEAYRDAGLVANAHVQNVGWQGWRSGYSLSVGTHGRSLRMEALKIMRPALDVDGDVVYSAHVQNVGWQGQRRNGAVAGSTGGSRRIEAITLALTGGLDERFDVWYRLHVQNVGWMGWAHDGERAGTEGMSLRVESIQVALVPSGAPAPAADGQATDLPFMSAAEAGTISYAALAGGSWSGWASDGATLGSESGAGFAGVRASLSGGLSGSVSYAVHVANVGWCPYVQSPADAAGGEVQAVRAVLSGEASRFFDVWYRACVQGVGWMGWAKNGADAGSVGASRPMVALQMRLAPKGGAAPGSTSQPVYKPFSSGDSELDGILDKIVRDVTGTGGDALKKGYRYVAGFGYKNQNKWPSGNWMNWSKSYAKEMYKDGSGNCYRYASLMCWIARKLGYDASVVCGECLTSMGWLPHGWVEIHTGGQTYIVDTEQKWEHPNLEFYMVTYDNAPIYYRK